MKIVKLEQEVAEYRNGEAYTIKGLTRAEEKINEIIDVINEIKETLTMKETTQPEEWVTDFLKSKHASSLSNHQRQAMILYFRTEIRRAEEKAYNQAIIDVIKVIPNDPEAESDRWNFASIGVSSFQDYKIGFREGFNCWKEEFISVVEALKK